LVLATFFGIILPSAKVVDLSVKTSAASAAAAVKPTATAAVATTKIDFLIMVVPLCFRGAQAASDVHINPIAAAKFLRNGTRTCESALTKMPWISFCSCPPVRPCEPVLANMPWISS